MPDGDRQLTARTVKSISEINADIWNALACPDDEIFNPFASYEFLDALEQSGSVAPEAGWAPSHIVIEDNTGIKGAAPLYIKGDSQGEYVFDHHWADAYARAGGAYYPKLLCAAPFTPVPGPRLLSNDEATRAALASSIIAVAERYGVSSAHVNFIGESELQILARHEFLPRIGEQFHWFNRGYSSFDDFLAQLSSRKRKAIKRERREAVKDGISVRRLLGDEITKRHWDSFWAFYQDTGARKWGHPYLTREFFDIASKTMSDRLLFIVAECEGTPIAGALNFIGGDALYGRYWGCVEDVPFLHFEICYHQAVDYAIEHGLSRVEAGAQGQHKIARGYEPVPTYSAHWIRDPGFREAIENYLVSERDHTNMEIDALKAFTPFRKPDRKDGP
ncbi:MAG: N-acetyltransferase [Marinicaulis sp.]|nr:N-acetyltransferase [Marinicaulis sp.]